MTDNHSMFLLDNFVATRPGDPYRLFPFGRFVKDGVARDFTPMLAAAFKLPHFKPPVKLGNHEDATPAGGHIVALEVREDGLYAVPEWNDNGNKAMHEGAYRYHSPEVLWEGFIEDPTNGAAIEAPLILGDALLHTPHLGEAAALYTMESNEPQNLQGDISMAEENVSVPKGLWDKFSAWLDGITKPVTLEEPLVAIPEEYTVALKERDEYKAKLEALDLEAQRKVRVEKYATELKDTKAANAELTELLAGMSEEDAGLVVKTIKALSAQVDESKLTGEQGSEGEPVADNPVMALDAAIRAKMGEAKVDYNSALALVRAQNPDLFKVYNKEIK